MGLYRLEGDAWKAILPGDFYAVRMSASTSGFAGGEGVFVQRAGSAWSVVDASSTWKVRLIQTTSDGAYVVGSGLPTRG